MRGSRTHARLLSSLSERVEQLAPEYQARVKALATEHGNKAISDPVTVSQLLGGMRGIKCMYTETSLLDVEEGIRFRGYSIPECQKLLPHAEGGSEPLPEGILWLMLTGEIPTTQQVRELSADLAERSVIPDHVLKTIDGFSPQMHPMSQFSAAMLALQTHSKFAAAYEAGENKRHFWKYYLDDSLDVIAKSPVIAARIYRNCFHGGKGADFASVPDKSLDWSANFASMLNVTDDPKFVELMRMYLTIHTDHEGGNVSAHATHLVGSALADPYLSFSAGLNGLAGPLHGLANQEVLRWILNFREKYGEGMDRDALVSALWDTLNSGNVIPGYGHAVLRKTDPRYTCQREFALKHLPEDPLFKLVSDMYEVVPGILTEQGKAKNPWPNVDAHSGVLLQHYGLTEARYYTVLFGVSRSMGVLSSLVLDRILGLPIERPKSLDLKSLLKLTQ